MVGSRRDPDFSHEWNGVFVMKPRNSIYLGDYNLDPPEDNEPEDGLTDAERRQKEFDDFDPPENDFGEPL